MVLLESRGRLVGAPRCKGQGQNQEKGIGDDEGEGRQDLVVSQMMFARLATVAPCIFTAPASVWLAIIIYRVCSGVTHNVHAST